MSKFLRLAALAVALLGLLSACNLPQATQTDPNAAVTIAAATLQARFTQDALLTSAAVTNTPLPPSVTPIPPTPTITFTPSPTATPICDLGQFMQDVTIPDGTIVQAGQTFTKTWRLKNIGSCAWSPSYVVIFDNGERMNGPASFPVTSGTVASSQVVDVSVELTAPATPGTYRGYWRLRNPSNVLIPMVSGHLGMSFFVEVKVVSPTSTPTSTPTQTITPAP